MGKTEVPWSDWIISDEHLTASRLRKFYRKHPLETESMFSNLDQQLQVLNDNRARSFLKMETTHCHREGRGLYAIAQYCRILSENSGERKTEMADTYKTAAGMAASILGEDAGQRVADLSAGKQIITALVSIRLGKGLTQKDVAERMGCAASTVSKLEAGTDAELRWSEIGNYSRAIGIQSTLVLDNPALPVTSRIKHRVIEIGDLLDEIVELAQSVDDDPEIIESIHDFYKELSFNFFVRYERSKDRLPRIRSWERTAPLEESATNDCAESEVEHTDLT